MIRKYQNSVLSKVQQMDLEALDKQGEQLTKLYHVTWEDTEQFMQFLKQLVETHKYTSVYGVPRAGLMLALLFSLKTEVPVTMAIDKNTLVIDDDTVSGLNLLPYYDKADTVVFGCCEDVIIKPTYIFKTFNKDVRRVWPWSN